MLFLEGPFSDLGLGFSARRSTAASLRKQLDSDGIAVLGFRFGVWGLGFGVWGLGFGL